MNPMPANPFQSLVIVAWKRADYLVHEIVRGLGLGRLPCKPFLLRPVRARLAADLARFEALTRRLLVLMVLEKGLPKISARPAVAPPPVQQGRGVPAPRGITGIPAFRLAEPAPRPGAAPPPRRAAGPLRPRILSLDQPLPPPEPWEYPPRPDDLLPSQPLVRRLVALHAVFDDPATHIARMARLIARSRANATARPYRLAPLPPAAGARHVPKDERDALFDIHTEAGIRLAQLDSS